MAVVWELIEETHAEKGFSDKQFHVRAYMVTQGKAELDEPPKKRLFGYRPSTNKPGESAKKTSSGDGDH